MFVLGKLLMKKRPGELHIITPGRRPFQVINVDYTGSFIKTKKGNCYVLVIIDNLTKFVQLYAVKEY